MTGSSRLRSLVARQEPTSRQQQPQVALQLNFALDSAALSSRAIAQLQELARALKDESLHHYKFAVEGHTCNLGSTEHNLDLSWRRAAAVYDWLTSFTNLSPQQFEVHGFGESCPLADNTSEAGRQKNRRVMIRNTLETPDITLKTRLAVLQIVQYVNWQEKILADGNVLKSAMPYAVKFAVADKSYVYICQIDASGVAVPIFPSPEYTALTNPVAPGSAYRIPETKNRNILLDNTVGEERFALLALDNPLDDPSSTCKRLANDNLWKETLLQRGVGGITTPKRHHQNSSEPPVTVNGMRLCQVMTGGLVVQPGQSLTPVATRGPAGIVSLDIPDQFLVQSVARTVQRCRGYILKRFFRHE